ncbi:glycosyltransferase family 39 protein [Kutzneria buriramensis]|uniref:Dolichyl-phosphate-mannose-protein mannosyltransferase n=1 Tax=Kutzneria buriramensis TaxID=1045776 RepID=A0A3E0H7C4_9PSEU|nr:glycosyltransferase family 39 protein [Kutzneria buriramensis]REH39208.1 dolichyl-phosphate-mannose-protein mannosyltransferase [Kutzneria buriramensis]
MSQATLDVRTPVRGAPPWPAPTRTAWPGVVAVAVGVLVTLIACASRYGYYRDELYFRMLSAHPAVGYVDQPPLTPLLAGLSTHLLGDTPVGIRVPAALCAAAVVILTAMITAELGGSTRAQVVAALGAAGSSFVLLVGHTLLTSSLDLVAWEVVTLFVLRALLRRAGRWWVFAGIAVGLALYNKYLVLLLCGGLLVGLALVGPRRLLVNRWLLAAVAIALVIGAPNIIYQATHGWPQLSMAKALSADGNGDRNRLFLLPGQLAVLGLPLAPIWLAGLVGLLRRPGWRPVRAVAVSYPVVLAVVFVTGGRLDYPAALVLVLFAAGCVQLDSFRRRTVGWALALNAAISVVLMLPVVPASLVARTPIPVVDIETRDSMGWPDLARQVAGVVSALPPDQRQSAVLLAQDYGEAGALARWQHEYGLPDVYSGHNELATWMPPSSANIVVAVGIRPELLAPGFARCTTVGAVQMGSDVVNQAQRDPIVVCEGLTMSWPQLWPRLTHLG